MRRQPVAFALVDTAFLADSKWRKLSRRLTEPTAFNSAIGAWLRILTAARRNGLPEVNSGEEAEDQTYLPDLIAAGLLTETGIPDKPYRAWAPARPTYQSDLTPRAHLAPKVTDAPSVTETPFPPLTRASTPLPSLLLNSLEDGGVQGGLLIRKPFVDPLLEQIRAAVIERYGEDQPIVPTRLPTAVEQERETHRLEALALHERYLRGELGPAEYERLRADVGKPDDDLTRLHA